VSSTHLTLISTPLHDHLSGKAYLVHACACDVSLSLSATDAPGFRMVVSAFFPLGCLRLLSNEKIAC
jgi:hypothetical protein